MCIVCWVLMFQKSTQVFIEVADLLAQHTITSRMKDFIIKKYGHILV